ncbi:MULTISPECIES: CBS domain-containing ParB/RepB/Spo0J family partition protein [unclassified Archaeoglobus]|mgnify:CR=1 FL=1|jgi:IMP dehydrogenase|uniref:CBS domain-containing ParB/RepB/Spo0J family partition protein n=1 Tax=unclassified Archaeoglobus TaxID=2643606 RepID=UPI0025B9D8C3|nr:MULTISPECIES: CBS domain-containing protein [unclassified Archaeoglobus]
MNIKVKEYMTKNVNTIKPDDTVEDAIKLVKETGHDSFPVVDNENRVVGYVSAVDIIDKDPKTKIKDIMSKELYVARDFMDLRDAARVMFRTGHSKLPVVDENNRLVGIISNADVIRSQIEKVDPDKVEKLKKTIEKVHGVKTNVRRGKVETARLIPTQSRIYADELRGRIHEIKRGLAEPIVVIKKDSRYYLVDGHHRVIAATKLGIRELDAYIIEVPRNVELGIEKLVRKKGLKSVRDIEIIEDVPHPLVEITFRNMR